MWRTSPVVPNRVRQALAANDQLGHGVSPSSFVRFPCMVTVSEKGVNQSLRKAPPQPWLASWRGAGPDYPAWNLTTSGTMSSATMLMILISGLMAGPAVSL